jgi:hypothetical protein
VAHSGAMNHEEAIIRAFIAPDRREQYLARLRSPKTRQKFMARHFHHMVDLDERYAKKLDPGMPLVEWEKRSGAHLDKIEDLLRSRGAPSRCHVMSASSNLDGQEVDLRAALEDVVGHNDGTFISCIPGRLAYFEGEGSNERYVLQRSD